MIQNVKAVIHPVDLISHHYISIVKQGFFRPFLQVGVIVRLGYLLLLRTVAPHKATGKWGIL